VSLKHVGDITDITKIGKAQCLGFFYEESCGVLGFPIEKKPPNWVHRQDITHHHDAILVPGRIGRPCGQRFVLSYQSIRFGVLMVLTYAMGDVTGSKKMTGY